MPRRPVWSKAVAGQARYWSGAAVTEMQRYFLMRSSQQHIGSQWMGGRSFIINYANPFDAVRLASVYATEYAELAVLSESGLNDLAERDPFLAVKMYRRIGETVIDECISHQKKLLQTAELTKKLFGRAKTSSRPDDSADLRLPILDPQQVVCTTVALPNHIKDGDAFESAETDLTTWFKPAATGSDGHQHHGGDTGEVPAEGTGGSGVVNGVGKEKQLPPSRRHSMFQRTRGDSDDDDGEQADADEEARELRTYQEELQRLRRVVVKSTARWQNCRKERNHEGIQVYLRKYNKGATRFFEGVPSLGLELKQPLYSVEKRLELLQYAFSFAPFFRDFSCEEAAILADEINLVRVEEGEMIAEAGTEVDFCGLLVSGRVKIKYHERQGAEEKTFTTRLFPGQLICPACVFLQRVALVTATCDTTNCIVGRIELQRIPEISRRSPALGVKLMKVLTEGALEAVYTQADFRPIMCRALRVVMEESRDTMPKDERLRMVSLTLRDCPFIKQTYLNDRDLVMEVLATHLHVVNVRENEYVLRRGDPLPAAAFLLWGTALLVNDCSRSPQKEGAGLADATNSDSDDSDASSNPQKGAAQATQFEPGDLMGDEAFIMHGLLGRSVQSEQVRAVTNATIGYLTHAALMDMNCAQPKLTQRIFTTMVRKYINTVYRSGNTDASRLSGARVLEQTLPNAPEAKKRSPLADALKPPKSDLDTRIKVSLETSLRTMGAVKLPSDPDFTHRRLRQLRLAGSGAQLWAELDDRDLRDVAQELSLVQVNALPPAEAGEPAALRCRALVKKQTACTCVAIVLRGRAEWVMEPKELRVKQKVCEIRPGELIAEVPALLGLAHIGEVTIGEDIVLLGLLSIHQLQSLASRNRTLAVKLMRLLVQGAMRKARELRCAPRARPPPPKALFLFCRLNRPLSPPPPPIIALRSRQLFGRGHLHQECPDVTFANLRATSRVLIDSASGDWSR
ncbi:hypothetical protein CYMTET_27467 [Cymbomonas tetramitiformis]|uniref:Cyclic nucleotide-binding domain-containing protein n=1 Tax=Cymbomonas tetramitiformis TaxID=36881 RepID=A0AAE0KX63_9CHLO|nr:hypothetical protein CYMTET_27467 [Cymbomonas tetramitiformis]